MEETFQKTWLAGPKTLDPIAIFENLDLKKWNILKVTRVGDACRDVHLQITYGKNGKNQKRRIRARCICETAPFQPDINGDWGVNPISVLNRLV